jgi:hypothetical protein
MKDEDYSGLWGLPRMRSKAALACGDNTSKAAGVILVLLSSLSLWTLATLISEFSKDSCGATTLDFDMIGFPNLFE